MEQQGQPVLTKEQEERGRQLGTKVIDRIASDPKFAKALKDDPENALREAGFEAEMQDVTAALSQPSGGEEVRGQFFKTANWGCNFYTIWWKCYEW